MFISLKSAAMFTQNLVRAEQGKALWKEVTKPLVGGGELNPLAAPLVLIPDSCLGKEPGRCGYELVRSVGAGVQPW